MIQLLCQVSRHHSHLEAGCQARSRIRQVPVHQCYSQPAQSPQGLHSYRKGELDGPLPFQTLSTLFDRNVDDHAAHRYRTQDIAMSMHLRDPASIFEDAEVEQGLADRRRRRHQILVDSRRTQPPARRGSQDSSLRHHPTGSSTQRSSFVLLEKHRFGNARARPSGYTGLHAI